MIDELASKDWQPGDWHYINKLHWGDPELGQVVSCLMDDWFGGNSKYNLELENRLKVFSGHTFAQTTNSGSAAIDLGVQALVQLKRWKPGDKIIVPRLNFPTPVSAAIIAGLIPIYVDVDPNTVVISADAFERAAKDYPEFVGAIIPALLGNVPDLDRILKALAGRPLLLDSCDVMGSKYNNKEVASYGLLASYSFYGSHHISTFGVGGALVTSDPEIYEYVHSMTFWGRDFSWDKADRIASFVNRYRYLTLGADAQMSAVQAAFGLAQFERLPEYIVRRWELFRELQGIFSRRLRWFGLPERASDKADISWFGYPFTIKPEAPFKREDFIKYLLDNKVEVRPIFTDLLKNKPFQDAPHIATYDCPNTENVYNTGLFIPAFAMLNEQKEAYLKIITDFLAQYRY